MTAAPVRAAIFAALLLFVTACSQNAIREERNLGPKSVSERAKDLKSAPEPTPEEYVARGDAAFKDRNWDKAIVEYVNALVGAPESPENLGTLIKIGRAHLQAGHADTAESTFRQVLSVRSDDVDAREGLGLALMNTQKPSEAQAELTKVLEVDPKRWQALNGLGIMFDIDGRMENAKPYYLRALEIVPKSSEVLNNLGYSYYLSGDLRSASQYFRRAIDTDRSNSKAWSNLGLVLAREGLHVDAFDAFAQVMDKAKALNSVGYVCLIANDFACAEEYFTRALDASPVWYVEAHKNLQRVRSSMPKPTQP